MLKDLLSAENFILAFQLLYITTAIGVIVVIITENRNPLKTITWTLILVFLPLVGLIIFYFFGEDGRRQRLISHKMYKRLNRKSIERYEKTEPVVVPSEYAGLVNLIKKLKGSGLYGGNKITFYTNGSEKLEALLDEIAKAEKFIHVQYYIFLDDETGRRVRDALIKKAEQGVKVRLIYDDVGSWKAKRRFFDDMQAYGIEVQPFLKVNIRFLASRVNYRNHRKVVIIDGQVGFVGGMNIADRYVQGINGGIWRDSHLKIEGKAVAALQKAFIVDWYYSRKEFLKSDYFFPTVQPQGDNLMQVLTAGPIGLYKSIHLAFLQAIYNAKKSIYIQTPYFIPTDTLMLAIQTAALRGVDVRLMIPRKSDSTFVQLATQAFLKEVLDAKVKVYFFDAGFLHSKLMIVDDDLIITGSANMDIRSFEHNFEIDLFVYNKDTCDTAKQIFFDDMNHSSLLLSDEWGKRSKMQRFKESVVRLFSPLL